MMLFSSRTASGTALMSTAQQQNLRKLTEIFQSTPENQSCADCGARLSDSIWASTTVGAFLCIHCAGCHRKLGVQLSRVKSVHLDSWSDGEVAAMKAGNRKVYENYGRFADKWVHVDAAFALQPTADIAARERCIRAKYEDLQFTKLPITVAVAPSPILRTEEKGHDSPENADESPVHTSSSTSSASVSPMRPNQENSPVAKPVPKEGNQDAAAAKPVRVVEVSKRFLNYFVVLGRGALVPNQNIEKSKSPTDIQFFPTTIDAFPEPHADSPPPSHLGQFAFPEGFSLSQTYAAPVFFSFVLTNVNGVKIYASALRFYEELHPLEVVSLLAPHYNHPPGYHRRRHGAHDTSNGNGEYLAGDNSDNQSGELPKWVQDLSGDMAQAPGPVFCPKCIVVTSHYPYFSAFRQFLQQIYRATLSQSPMPIERYIANFVSEIPLPPPGLIQVQLTLPDKTLVISRPPKNDFPLVDFSFRPLFQSLDINNILLVFSCVILECKVVLCSKHIALLTPAAETLLALLLPYSWQGAYIPVLPASLLDVIDAPVPFLVGTHSDCLKLAAARTSGVVFVDLDHNRVIPAVDDSGKTIPIPKIPEREGAKLRLKLTEFASIFDPYASGISKVDLAFANEEHLEPLGSFATERGQTIPLQKSVSDASLTDSFSSIYSMGKIMRGRRNSNANSAPSPSGSSSSATSFSRASRMASQASSGSTGPSVASDGASGLTESRFNESDGFSTEGIRKAFLRFFVTLFKKYALYLNMSPRNGKHGNDSLFDGEAFLRENHDAASRPFMAQLIATQMFDRFVEDRVFSPRLPEVLFFDQSINQKLNRSLSIGKKKYDCSFLDDRADDIQETFIAPAPSNIGLPDDGTVYNYKAFPRLKKSLFGNVRKPRELYSSREQQRNISQVDFHQRIFTMSKCIKGSSSSWEATRRLIIHLQAKYRMYSARKQFLRTKHAATTIQRHVKARIQARANRKEYLALRHGAIMFQKTFRMFATRKLYRCKCAALKAIQFFARGYVEHNRYKRAVRGFRRLQAQWRSSFYKKSYKNLKYQLVRVQSRVRGFLSRKQTMRWKQEMFDSFRKRIFDLWEKCDVPLLHRSKFWLTFDRPDFFNLGIYMEEEHRLKAYFRDSHAVNDAYEYSTQTEVTSQNDKQSTVRRVTMSALKHMIKPKKRDDRKSINDIAVVRVEEERVQIYEALKRQTSAPVRLSFYEQFKIPPSSRKKKRRLASMVWNTFDDAGISAEIVVSISASSDRYHPLPAQIDRHKQLRIRDDLAFTVNAALKSIRYAARPDPSLVQPRERELVELQHQVRMLANQNHRLMGELVSSQREMGRLQMELQLQQQPQLRKITSEQQRDSTSGGSTHRLEDLSIREQAAEEQERRRITREEEEMMVAPPPSGLTELPDELLARVLELAAPRDLEAVTVASRAVALHVLPRFPLWKALFCYRWAMLNFPLLGDAQSSDKSVAIEIDPRLCEMLPSVTESRMYQLLAHAITPVPSYADVDATTRFRKNTWMDHTITSLGKLDSGIRQLKPRPLDFAFAGCNLGGNRSVRANAPFSTTLHVQVFKVRASNGECSYKVGVTASGYFEITISKRECPCGVNRVAASDMTAIGVGSHSFRLTDKQPGWDSDSYGYHGDDGHFFHCTGRGRDFGPSFDVGDTVGCGVRRNMRDRHSSVFFTHSGDLIPTGARDIECEHEDWFPVVGLDSANAVHVNYGQEPFHYEAIVDELFDECRDQVGVLANQLQWYNISESDIETSSDEEMSEGSSTDQDDFDDFFGEDEDDSMAEGAAADFLHRLLLFSRGFGGSSHEDEEDSLIEFEDADEE